MTAIFYLLTLILPLATILIVFAMRYYAIVQQAKARLANDDAYRQLAEGASAAQSRIATSLAAPKRAHSTGLPKIASMHGANAAGSVARW